MTFRLVVSAEVFAALDAFVDYIAVECQAPRNAERWLKKAWKSLESLQRFPQRCPYAPENDQFSFDVRMQVVDRCLFLFTVDTDNRVVRVFAFRHGSQQPLEFD